MNIRRTIVIVPFILSGFLSRAQWFPVNQDTTFTNTEVFFLNSDTGFVVGEYVDALNDLGVISRTLNGGISWDTITKFMYIPSISFPSNSIGYCGGQDGIVYKTTNMGITWTEINSFCCNDYSNMLFFNNDTGFVSLWSGILVKTLNGGSTWNYDTTIGGSSPYPGVGSIQFMHDSIGIIAAGLYGTYARTFDKGNTWQTGHIDSNMNVISIYMRNLNIGYAVGYDGKYSRTFDGGQTWTTPIIFGTYHLNDIAFFTDSIGYIVGGDGSFPFDNTQKGIIYKTIDAGNTWFVEDSTYDAWLTSIVAVTNSVGYAAGRNGRILKIINGNNVDINENSSHSTIINVFPNPSAGIFTFTFSNISSKKTLVNVYDLFGKLIKSQKVSNVAMLDISQHANGFYIYEINEPEKITMRGKILKGH